MPTSLGQSVSAALPLGQRGPKHGVTGTTQPPEGRFYEDGKSSQWGVPGWPKDHGSAHLVSQQKPLQSASRRVLRVFHKQNPALAAATFRDRHQHCPCCHVTSQGHRAQPQALSRASGGTQPAHPEGFRTPGLTPKQWPQPGSTCPCCTPQCRGLSLPFLPGLRTSVAPGDLPHRLL